MHKGIFVHQEQSLLIKFHFFGTYITIKLHDFAVGSNTYFLHDKCSYCILAKQAQKRNLNIMKVKAM